MSRILSYLDNHLEEVLLVLTFAIMSSFIVLQVFMRYVLNNSLSWSEEMARYLFIWLTYLGISYGVRKDKHIRVTAISLVLNERLNKACLIFSNIVFLAFSTIVTYVAWGVALKTMKYGQISSSLGVPMYLIYFSVPVGYGLTSFRLVQSILKQFKTKDGVLNQDDLQL